jgi:hypothetical protein
MELVDATERVRRAVYDAFAHDGHAPRRADIGALVGLTAAEVDGAIAGLVTGRHLVVDGSGEVVMAHPFSSVNLGFSVMGEHVLWWGGCAWDSFALPHLVPSEPVVLVATTCPACGRPLAWRVGRDAAPAGDEVAHFLVPMAECWDDVVRTCAHQRVFCSTDCVDRWLSDTGQPRGYVMDLATLWRLAAGWYAGRLDSPYARRDPASAAEYFRGVGLHGAFWGLPD